MIDFRQLSEIVEAGHPEDALVGVPVSMIRELRDLGAAYARLAQDAAIAKVCGSIAMSGVARVA